MNDKQFERLLKESVAKYGSNYFDNENILEFPHTFPENFKADIDRVVKSNYSKKQKFHFAAVSAAAAVIAIAAAVLLFFNKNEIPIDTQNTASSQSAESFVNGSVKQDSEYARTSSNSAIDDDVGEYETSSESQTKINSYTDEKSVSQNTTESVDEDSYQGDKLNTESQTESSYWYEESVSENNTESSEQEIPESLEGVLYDVKVQMNGKQIDLNEFQTDTIAEAAIDYINGNSPDNQIDDNQKMTDEIYITVAPDTDDFLQINNQDYINLQIFINHLGGLIGAERSDGEKEYFTFDDTEPIYQTVISMINQGDNVL